MGTKYILKIVPIKFAEGLTVGMGWCVREIGVQNLQLRIMGFLLEQIHPVEARL